MCKAIGKQASYLRAAGLILEARRSQGRWRLTERGRQVLEGVATIASA